MAILGLRNASETVEQCLSNASKTLDQHPTCSPWYVHPLLEVSWPVGKASWSTTSMCESVHGSSRLRPLTSDLPHYISYTMS